MSYFCTLCGWHPCRCDWRELERQRRLEHPEIQGVSWTCDHRANEPTSGRGPLPKRGHAHRFEFVNDRSTLYKNFRRDKRHAGAIMRGGVEWNRAS